jgi:hypothetical protein
MIGKIMNKKIKLYSATKGKKEHTPLHKSFKYNEDIQIHFNENNKQSLQKCYNSFLEDARLNSIDIAVFLHDDVYINTDDLRIRITNSAEQFTVFGLAGTATCNINGQCLWHLMGRREDLRGCVAHGTKERYSYTSFGYIPSRCLLIDGVFIGIDIKNLPDKVKFDESYPSKFHYYDLDFSLECNRNKVIIGVVDIPIIHSSPGLTNPTEEFYKGQKYFKNKWKQ